VEYRQHSKSSEPEQRKPSVLPQAHTDMRRVFAYLIKQHCVSREVLSEFVREKLLFEDAEYHNAVFVGFDENGTARHVHKKSTTTGSIFASMWREAIRPTAFIIFLRIQIPTTCLYSKRTLICFPISACIRRTGKTPVMWR